MERMVEMVNNRLEVSRDIKLARMYWGPGPLPEAAKLIGVVTRPNREAGALIKMGTGIGTR